MTTSADDLRPTAFSEYIGQAKLKEHLSIAIESAKIRYAPLEHTLLVGPAGYGKTTLARIIATELQDDLLEFKVTPQLDMRGFAYQVLERGRCVIFLDELHNASKAFQEMLLHATESGEMHIGDVIYDVRTCTFIGATTERDKILPTLRDRFNLQPRFEDYADEDMTTITAGMARRAEIELPDEVVSALARAAGGTPRIAGRLVLQARDLVVTKKAITVDRILELAGFDPDGLSDDHVHYMTTLRTLGGESGLKNISTMMQTKPATIEDLERLLVKRGFVKLTPSGRTLTTEGIRKIMPTQPTDSQYRRVS